MEEVSSPTSPCGSAQSCPVSPSPFAVLPVASLKNRIVEKIRENRVTLIVGETGCGKSSQVPQFLLEQDMAPVLCTQPRRFAVVAVAKMVAQARNCELGGEVGYHIGHSKVLSTTSKIVFKTAGVLLDEMRDKGFNALKYKVIILDEVHERSVESDLVLVCVKQFLQRNNDLRVVLMSATADIGRYRDYFRDLGRGERVEVLAIPSPDEQFVFQKKVLYLEQITRFLGFSSESLASRYCSGPSPSVAGADMKPDVHKIIHDLIQNIHQIDPDIEKGILVFLPTYRDLEQQWYLLKPFTHLFKVHVLHSSIETSEALLAMRICKSHRKVILATNIAESSVTIPNVAHVIDSCRSLQVFWSPTLKRDCTKLVWVSKSQADQRKGRTGRTCDGQIYRLVPGSFFGQLEDYECPTIQKLSLRLHVLLISCAAARTINDPKGLLRKALDPPSPEVVEDALTMLVRVKALDRTNPSGRCVPTFYGHLLASFSLTFDASVLIVKFGSIGMLREGVLLAILMDTVPVPILRPFGEEHLYKQYTGGDYGGDCSSKVKMGPKEMELLGNLNAYQFWQRVFRDKHRMERLKHISKSKGTEGLISLFPAMEEEWCSFHNLVKESLHHVSERYEDIMTSLHRFRPKFLSQCDGLPVYYEPHQYVHTCHPQCEPRRDAVFATAEDEHQEEFCEMEKCTGAPYVASDQFKTIEVARNFSNIVKEVRVQSTEEMPTNLSNHANGDSSYTNGMALQCAYFANGYCHRGDQCLFSHSSQARRAPCNFFFSLQGCRNGETCRYSHDSGQPISSFISTRCPPEDDGADAGSLLRLFPTFSCDGFVLLLDDPDLRLTSNLTSHYDPSRIISTTSMSNTSVYDPALRGVRILWGLSNPHETFLSDGRWDDEVPWSAVECILWSPNLETYDESWEKQQVVVQELFERLAVRILADDLCEARLILIINNIKFSQLQVEKLGRECFFFLRESFPFDEGTFGKIPGSVASQKAMVVYKTVAYVFEMCPPSHVELGDYRAAIRKGLWGIDDSRSRSSSTLDLRGLNGVVRGLRL
ncbi:unnamed protein product [Linum tenue]|uniref:RNA helicase n=1 Tax=Linum tenue TaxID=586396 RepID=A0AAV0PFR5_9ROSI|nr:unnamed protein product [Linum tenue]